MTEIAVPSYRSTRARHPPDTTREIGEWVTFTARAYFAGGHRLVPTDLTESCALPTG